MPADRRRVSAPPRKGRPLATPAPHPHPPHGEFNDVALSESLFRAGCRFSLGSCVPVWGARVPWCRAGRACWWCAARRGGCGIIRVDRPSGWIGYPLGAQIHPAGHFHPVICRARGGRGTGAAGRAGPGGQEFRGRRHGGRFAGRGRAEATGPRWAHGGLWFRADRTYPGYLTGALAPSPGARAPQAADGRTGRPACGDGSHRDRGLDHQRRAELAGWLWDLSKTPY